MTSAHFVQQEGNVELRGNHHRVGVLGAGRADKLRPAVGRVHHVRMVRLI